MERRSSSVSDGPRSPRLGGSGEVRLRTCPKTYVGSFTPLTVAHSTIRLPSWQYAAFARSFHGSSHFKLDGQLKD